jgi:hypothetical protein
VGGPGSNAGRLAAAKEPTLLNRQRKTGALRQSSCEETVSAKLPSRGPPLRPAHPGFIVMKTLQLGRSASSVPSNTKDASPARMAACISDTCCATTDRTWRGCGAVEGGGAPVGCWLGPWSASAVGANRLGDTGQMQQQVQAQRGRASAWKEREAAKARLQVDAVELVKACPRARRGQPLEELGLPAPAFGGDVSGVFAWGEEGRAAHAGKRAQRQPHHRAVVQGVAAIEHHALPRHRLCEVLGRLGLAGAGGPGMAIGNWQLGRFVSRRKEGGLQSPRLAGRNNWPHAVCGSGSSRLGGPSAHPSGAPPMPRWIAPMRVL